MTIAAFVLTAIDRRYVAEDHLRVLCIPFVAGRAFGEADHRAAGWARGPWSTRHSPSGSGGGRRTVIGTRLQMTAIDIDDQGREIASASWSTCGHAGVTATAPTVFVPVERVPDDLLGQVHRGPNV